MRTSELPAATLLLWLWLCAAAATAGSAPRDEPSSARLAAESLPELLARPLSVAPSQFDTQLQLTSLKCRELGVFAPTCTASTCDGGGDASSDSTSVDAVNAAAAMTETCRKVRYVRLSRKKMRETLQAELARVQKEHEVQEDERESSERSSVQEIETKVEGSMELQEFFESYAETARPVVLDSSGEDIAKAATHPSDEHPLLGFTSSDEWNQFVAACFVDSAAGGSDRVAPLRVRDDACVPHLERLRVPLYLVHDYIQRTNVSQSDTFLPSLMRVQPSWATTPKPDAIVSCPLGLHMLMLLLPNTGGSASQPSAGIQTFDQRLKPFLKSSKPPQVAEVVLSASSGGIVDPENTRENESARLPHIAPLHHKPSIAAGSFVFVPGSQFAVMRPPPPSGANTAQNGIAEETPATLSMLRFCFVDASNFNAVKQEVALEALVNDEAYTLLQSLQSHAFDRSMFRRPQLKDTVWSSFVTWPKETKLLKKSGLDSSELQLSRRERLKQWQDDKRWDRHVEALTLPVSLPPVVVNTTRTTATLRFQDLYETPKHDITAYGYVVRWRNIDEEAVLAAARHDRDASSSFGSRHNAQEIVNKESSLVHELPPSNEMNVTRQHLVRSALPTTLFGDGFDGKDIEVVVHGLLAETRYTFSVQIYVDDTSGLESESSRIAQTAPCSEPSGVRGAPAVSDSDGACTTLQWLDPADDGGKSIRLYLINARIIEDPISASDAELLVLDVWSSHFSPRAFHVSSEIVRADPLDASIPLRNAEQVKDRVVLVARGGVPFVFKTHYAQLAGALGIIIVDVNDTCRGRFDQTCVPGGDKNRGEGFAAQDRHVLWTQNRIPCVLALHADAQRLLDLVRGSE